MSRDIYNLEISRKIHSQASKLLIKLNLENRLKHYGKVQIIGSYALEVMWDRDIDVMVSCEEGFESSKRFLLECVDNRLVQKVDFGDFEKFPRKN